MAADWKPADNIEVVVGASPGGGNDNIARTMQKIIQDRRLVEVPFNIVNKPGAGGAVAYAYLNLYAGNPHYLGVSSNTLLTNHITGTSKIFYEDITPIAVMINEYINFVVKADSSLKTGSDLIARLKADPGSVVFGISSVLGNINHIAVATVARAVGVDAKKLKVVVFSGSGGAVTGLLGGHVEVVAGPPSIALKHIEAGMLRSLAVTSPKRLADNLAKIPTWREQGVDAVVVNWRGVIGPKGLNEAQITYWNQVFGKLAQTEEWNNVLRKNQWVNAYVGGKEASAYMSTQYSEFKNVLTALGLAR